LGSWHACIFWSWWHWCFPLHALVLRFRIILKAPDSSPVIILSKKLFPSATWRERSEQISSHRCFWSSDKIRGTMFA
jgi:hypothetical protein